MTADSPSPESPDELTIVHDEANSRYVLMRHGTELGETVYARPKPGVIEFLHTGINPSQQEHGLGSRLAAGALDDVRATSNDRVVALCPFIRAFIQRHPDYADLTRR